jgi:disulfide bond formation protein DsbB
MFVLFYFYAIVILGTVAVPATSKEAFMNSKIVSVALSLAMALSGASVAMAGGKKAPVDPRVAYQAHPDKTLEWGRWRQNACDMNPECNGWAAAERLAKAGKLKL